MSPAQTFQYQAYKSASVTTAKTRQIVMLFDGAIRFMQQAKDACEKNDIAGRYNLLVRAGEIVMGLQNSLDFDNGGEVARILYDFYARVDMEILSVHKTGNPEMCGHIIKELKSMRDAWDTIDREKLDQQDEGASPGNVPDAATIAALSSAGPSAIALSA